VSENFVIILTSGLQGKISNMSVLFYNVPRNRSSVVVRYSFVTDNYFWNFGEDDSF
jgi:hypothetical protein